MGSLRGTRDWSELRLPIPDDAVAELVRRGYVDEDADLIPPAVVTPTPSLDRKSKHFEKGVWFDVDEVCRVVDALRGLRHTKGRRWSGRPLNPEAWQVLWIVAPVFGWKNAAGVRVIRDVWIEIPRKNGKTTLISGLLIVLLLADRELGAEVYAAAASTAQAGQVFEPAKQMLLGSPVTRGKVKVLSQLVRVPRTGGLFRVLSKVAETAHGLNVSGAGIDEIHVHKSRDLIDAIETGTGARDQPLIFFITTSDDGQRTSIYSEKHDDVEGLAADLGDPDHSRYGVIWSAPEGLDPFALDTIRMANPNIGVSVSEEYLVKQAQKAQRTPSYLPTYERLHLNRRRRQQVRAIDMVSWDEGSSPRLTIEQLRRRLRDKECFGGLDIATTQDFCAWALVFPDEFEVAGDLVEGCWILPRLWVPSASVDRRSAMRNTLLAWADEGWITVHDGEVVDFDRVQADIEADAEAHRIGEFAFDPWQAEMLRQHLVDGGLTGWKCGQTMERLAPATQELDRLLASRAGLVRHGGNPALAWMASNVVAKRDSHGRWKPEKTLSGEKIDGFSAACMGIAAWRRIDREPVYKPATAVAAGDHDGQSLWVPDGPLDI